MLLCIALENLALHLPTLKRVLITYCTQGIIYCSNRFIAKDIPGLMTGAHVVRSSSGGDWAVRPMKEARGTHFEMSWIDSPHPGQVMQIMPWTKESGRTSRKVIIDYHDSEDVSGAGCVRAEREDSKSITEFKQHPYIGMFTRTFVL